MAKSKPRQEQPEHDPPATEDSNILSLAQAAWNEVHSVQKGAVKLHFWLMAVVSFLQPYAVAWFDSTDSLPKEPWPFYWAVLQTTAPLTIGLVIWAVLLVAFWPKDSDSSYWMIMSFVGGGILIAAAKIGNALGAQQIVFVDTVNVFMPINLFANALLSYLNAYRGVLFVSSVAIASYAGYITYRWVHVTTPTEVQTEKGARRKAA